MPQEYSGSMCSAPENYHIRLGTPGDIPWLHRIECAADELFRSQGVYEGVEAMEVIPADVFVAAMQDGLVHIAEHASGALAGFTLSSLRAPDLYLDQISVDPDHGRKGLGRALMACIIEEARRRKVPSISLSTFRHVPWNAPFYATLGFKEVPRRALTTWMRELEDMQAATLDVTQRCFMRRPMRRFALRWQG